jgi:hypothetical protein
VASVASSAIESLLAKLGWRVGDIDVSAPPPDQLLHRRSRRSLAIKDLPKLPVNPW